jgi:hypothetical protein
MNKAIDVGVDHFRVLEAIRQIGYRPEEAIMDIADNSVSAGASHITIELVAQPNSTINSRNSSAIYRILDDGHGMTSDEIQKAFRLGGQPKKYDLNSLSKFGMGLKSAGLSIGNKITVISKSKADTEPTGYQLSADVIKETGKWAITRISNEDIRSIFPSFFEILGEGRSGTLVEISDIRTDNHASLSRTQRKLHHELAVVYGEFLKSGLKISLKILKADNKPIEIREISAIDPTCYEEALETSPADWDIETPLTLIKKDKRRLTSEDANIKGEIALTLLPKPKKLRDIGKLELANKYRDLGVGPSENQGFYIYRNNRLISWGDDLDSIISRHGDFAGLRGSLKITGELDSFFNINVKKSKIVLSDEVHGQLTALLKLPIDNVRKADERYDVIKAQIIGDDPTSSINQDMSDFDAPVLELEPGFLDPETTEQSKRRIDTIANESKEKEAIRREERKREIESGTELPPEPKRAYQPADKFRIAAFISDVRSLWDSGLDASYGTYVTLNNLHPYYRTHLVDVLRNDDFKKVIGDVFFALAHAQNEVRKSFKISDPELKKAFQSFIQITSDTLYARAGKKALGD